MSLVLTCGYTLLGKAIQSAWGCRGSCGYHSSWQAVGLNTVPPTRDGLCWLRFLGPWLAGRGPSVAAGVAADARPLPCWGWFPQVDDSSVRGRLLLLRYPVAPNCEGMGSPWGWLQVTILQGVGLVLQGMAQSGVRQMGCKGTTDYPPYASYCTLGGVISPFASPALMKWLGNWLLAKGALTLPVSTTAWDLRPYEAQLGFFSQLPKCYSAANCPNGLAKQPLLWLAPHSVDVHSPPKPGTEVTG